jgi:cellulose synthase/poly-beta-1,6-N-acetylglucosamine synthase-like glycosyltransferase
MQFWLYLLLISGFIVFYNYAGYAVIASIVNKWRHPPAIPNPTEDLLPSVSFIVAAYNEEDCIEKKIANSLELDYPTEKIEFLFISDGSDDRTLSVIHRFTLLRSLHQPQRMGKSAALNRAVTKAQNEILIFSDSNTLLNKEAIRQIARHYLDEKIGGVAGEKRVLPAVDTAGEVGEGEGLYWKYESFLKKTDAAFYSVVGAAGELFSVRRSLYTTLPDNVILDDFVCSLKVAQQGYRIQYEPSAYAVELPSFSMEDERKRKIRIAAGGFQAIGLLTPLLAFWKQPRLSFLYLSHRVLRWAISPFCLIVVFIAGGMLALKGAGTLFLLLFLLQCCFYGIAALAALLPSFRRRSRPAKLAYYFVFMNACAILGFFRYLRGNQPAAWEKARRAQAVSNA